MAVVVAFCDPQQKRTNTVHTIVEKISANYVAGTSYMGRLTRHQCFGLLDNIFGIDVFQQDVGTSHDQL